MIDTEAWRKALKALSGQPVTSVLAVQCAFDWLRPELTELRTHQLTCAWQARSADTHKNRPGVLQTNARELTRGVTFRDSGQGETRAISAAMGRSGRMMDPSATRPELGDQRA